MAAYNMPPDTSAKEKLVGGILDMTQLIFLLIGLAIGLGIGFLFLKPMFDMVGLAIGVVIGVGAGLIFGFVKIKDLSLLNYFRYKKKHQKKTKKLPNVRINGLDKEDLNSIRNF